MRYFKMTLEEEMNQKLLALVNISVPNVEFKI